MIKIIKDGKTFTMPKKNLVPFAQLQAMERHIFSGPVHDTESAIAYLSGIGIEVKE